MNGTPDLHCLCITRLGEYINKLFQRGLPDIQRSVYRTAYGSTQRAPEIIGRQYNLPQENFLVSLSSDLKLLCSTIEAFYNLEAEIPYQLNRLVLSILTTVYYLLY